MTVPFDPYVKWLGIRTPERPPNHYLLLGLTPFEADLDVIDAASNRQMAHVRTYQSGAQSAISQRILNELAAARVELLNPEKKIAYDTSLQLRLQQRSAPTETQSEGATSAVSKALRTRTVPILPARPTSTPYANATAPAKPDSQATPDDARPLLDIATTKTKSNSSAGQRPLIMGRLAILGLLLVGAVAFLFLRGEDQPAGDAPQASASVAQSQSTPKSKSTESVTPVAQPVEPELPTPTDGGPSTPSIPPIESETPSTPVVPHEAESESEPMPNPNAEVETPNADQTVTNQLAEDPVADSAESDPSVETGANDSSETPAESDVPARRALPDAASRQAALKSVQQIFNDEYSKAKTSATQSALAAQLLEQGRESQENPTDQFVLLAEALRLATEAGDVDTALSAWDESVEDFDIDNLGGTAKVLSNLSKKVKASNQQQSLAQRAGDVFDAALEAGKLELASELAELASAAAKKAKDPELVKSTASRVKQFQDYKKLAQDAEVAQKTLKSKPDDPDANLVQGRFLCLGQDNWKAGLVLLTKGPDSPLRKAAEGDLAAGDDPKSWISRGDAWFELAKTAKEFEPRAAYWYQRSVGEVFGLEQARVEKRLSGLESTGLVVRSAGSDATGDDGMSSAAVPSSMDSPWAVVADQIVLWNAHSRESDVGTRLCHVVLLSNEQPVWTKRNVSVPWFPDRDEKVVVDVPKVRFDTVRIEVVEWEKAGLALSEVEVLLKGKNIARGARVRASSFTFTSEGFGGFALVDGNASSAEYGVGYWVPQIGRRAWAEIDMRQPTSGIVADRLVLWNQHNGEANSRGSDECNVALLLGSKEVWRKDNLTIPWVANSDEKLELPLPKMEFNRVRVEITKHHGSAGLAEIEVWRGNRNLALGVPARTNGVWNNSPAFIPERVTDGITTSKNFCHGYWLAPDGWPAWVEVDLDLPAAQPPKAIKGDRLVLWNQRNGDHGLDSGRGADYCDVIFYNGPHEVERHERIRIPWSTEIDAHIALPLPRVPFTRVRIDLTSWLGQGGGLGEIEIFRKGQNIAPLAKVSASAEWGDGYEAERAIDGITSATGSGGFWLLPDNTPGWIELDLGPKR